MKKLIQLLTLAVCAGLFVPAASAAGSQQGKSKGKQGMSPEMRQKILEQFDADGDGKLNDTEKAAAQAERQKMMDERKAEMQARKAELLEKFDTGL